MITNGLRRDHEATPRQCEITFPKTKEHVKPTQADVLLAMLREAWLNGKPVELPQVMQAGIAQYGARVAELRERGFVIDNEMERTAGRVLSRYWLRFDPERDGAR